MPSGPPRSMRLLAWHFTAAGTSPVFTCPADCVTLVKSAYLFNAGAAPVDGSIGVGQGTFNLSIVPVQPVAINAVIEWAGWTVLNPGEYLYAGSSGADLIVWISGAVLLGPPPFPPGEQADPVVFLEMPVVLPAAER